MIFGETGCMHSEQHSGDVLAVRMHAVLQS